MTAKRRSITDVIAGTNEHVLAGASTCKNELVGAEGREHLSKTPENDGVTEKRGTESGTLGGDSTFTDAVAAVMSLPLSDAEKAAAVRLLLFERDQKSRHVSRRR